MPVDSVGFDAKMSALDVDPKTYSPMSGSDENMSSPPSILTAASAGSCTPSSLPSAGSTPSSIPSAGSTPYQFVSQEESTVIKPFTPSDSQSVHSFTPDQPVTPEPSVLSDLSAPYNEGSSKKCISPDVTPEPIHLCQGENVNISDEVNERREGCPCIMCSDKAPTPLPPPPPPALLPEKEKEGNSQEGVTVRDSINCEKRESDKVTKGKTDSFKHKRKNSRKSIHYQSELTEGPESTSIKIKIKLTPAPIKHKKKSHKSSFTVSSSPSFNIMPSNSNECANKSVSNLKRKHLHTPSEQSVKKKRIRSKLIDNFTGWGPIESKVNGEEQSKWGYLIPKEVLEKIFLFVTYSEGCLPFLFR